MNTNNNLTGLIVAASLLALVGCGGGSSSSGDENPIAQPGPTTPNPEPPPPEPPGPEPSDNEKFQKLKDKVSSFVTKKLDGLAELDCNTETKPEACEEATVAFSSGEFINSKVSADQTILVIDDEGIEAPGVLRYRSRVKNYYTPNENGLYRAYDPTLSLPKFAVDIAKELNDFTDAEGKPAFVPSAWLGGDLGRRIYEIDENITRDLSINAYGQIPFSHLSEHNPKAEFVLARRPKFFEVFHSQFCALEFDELTTKITKVAEDFYKKVIVANQVEYINWSSSYNIESVRSDWRKNCGPTLPSEEKLRALLLTIKPFYKALFSSSNVFGIQSSKEGVTRENRLYADTSFNNRLTVGHFLAMNSMLPADGIINNKAIYEELKNPGYDINITNVLINTGVDTGIQGTYSDTPIMHSSFLGVLYIPVHFSHADWTTPVALSRVINIKNTKYANEPLSDSLITAIKQDITPSGCGYSDKSCYYQDPVLHKQFELFRLGYLTEADRKAIIDDLRSRNNRIY